MFVKGQGATEYLVLLAVVLMIALVSIALLGFFPGLAGDAKATQSQSYWKAARPIGILEHSQSGTILTLLIQNNDPDQRVITRIDAGGTGVNTTSITLNSGEKKSINLISAPSCVVGGNYEYLLNFTYNTNDLSSLKQIGTKPLVGKCIG